MRWALIAALALLPSVAAAENSGATRLGVYQDDDHTLVVTPVVAVSAAPSEGARVDARYLADMVTSSSVDLVSAATEEFSERRDDLSLSAGYTTQKKFSFGAGYDWSHERDYVSHTVSGNVGQELFDRNLQLSLGWATSFNTVGRSGDPTFSEEMTNHSLTVSGAQVLGKGSILRLTYQGQRAEGFQASVYRYVEVGGFAGGYRQPEVVPDVRWRHAAAVALNQHLGGPLFGQADYRLYRDTWGVLGNTFNLRLILNLLPGLDLHVRERVHLQGAAEFYAERYDAPQSYMTSDKELGGLWSSTTGLKLDYLWRAAAGGGWGVSGVGVDVKADYLTIRYDAFARLDGLSAWIGEVGTRVLF